MKVHKNNYVSFQDWMLDSTFEEIEEKVDKQIKVLCEKHGEYEANFIEVIGVIRKIRYDGCPICKKEHEEFMKMKVDDLLLEVKCPVCKNKVSYNLELSSPSRMGKDYAMGTFLDDERKCKCGIDFNISGNIKLFIDPKIKLD